MGVSAGKRCCRCGKTKHLQEFGRDRTTPDGLARRCKECCREKQRNLRIADPERTREASRRYRETHPEKTRAASRRWAAANPERRRSAPNPEGTREASRRWYAANSEAARRRYAANPEPSREVARRRHAANREAVLDHYGRSCACCGTMKRLGIDHVNGDGKEHRAQIGMGSSRLYRWLIANGFPGGFQVLCGWCNQSKADGERCRIDH